MPSPNCGFRFAEDVSRNSMEMREVPSANCGLRVVCGISRNFIEEYAKCRRQTVDFTLPIVFHAI